MSSSLFRCRAVRATFQIVSLLSISALAACGGKGAEAGGEAKVDLDADPYALLPGSALAVGKVDARALYASSAGPDLGALADSLMPLGDDAGFKASRDVDSVVVAAYAATEADVAAVVSGRFDVAKISAANATKQGTPIVHTPYAGFATDTIGPVTFAPISAKTVVTGTTERVHRVLDRIQRHDLTRAVPSWMVDTLGTAGASFALAGDFVSTPVASAALKSINVPWLQGLQVARVIGDFNPPGLNAAATLTYADAAGAQAAADGLRMVDNMQKVLAPVLLGAKLDNLQVSSNGQDASCKFAVDSQSIHALLTLASRYVHP
jgi:hypothetical protein